MEFCIPLCKDDLLSSATNGYTVEEVLIPSCLDEKLEDASNNFHRNGAEALTNHFDVFFSVLHHSERLQEKIKIRAWNIIMSNMKEIIGSFQSMIEQTDNRCKYLCLLKMQCYLLCEFIEDFERDATKQDIITTDKKGKKKKVEKSAFDWGFERHAALTAINKLTQLDLHKLWDPPIVEDEFTSLISNMCYKLLENATFVRNKEDRDVAFRTLGHLIKRYNHRQSASLKIVLLLQHFEHIVSPLAQALQIFVEEYDAHILVCDIIREISRMDVTNLTRDASGTRSLSQFLVEIAEKIPTFVLPNISLLMSHLDGESYTMRNGVLGVFGEIVAKVLKGDELDEAMKKSRDSFLDRIEDHIHDIHAFVRSKVIQICLHLVQEKALPIPRQGKLLDLVIGRLCDKSSQVRKYAIQFLKTSLVGNPFAAKLSLDQLTKSLEKENEKLKELNKDKEDVEAAADEQWLGVIAPLREAIDHFVSEERMEDVEGEHLQQLQQLQQDEEEGFDKALLMVQSALKAGELGEAVELLHFVANTWPEELEVGEEEQKMYEEQYPEENEEDEEEETPNSEDVEKERIKILKMKLFIFSKKIFKIRSVEDKDTGEKKNENENTVQKTTEPNELEKQKVLVTYLTDCVRYAHQMNTVIPILCKLLGSKVNSDVMETIDFFIVAFEFGLSESEKGIRRMASLIWSKDTAIKTGVVNAFEKLYIDVQCDNPRNKDMLVAKRLVSLVEKANLGELTSLEEILCELMKADLVPQSVIQILWQVFAMKLPNTSESESCASIKILSMFAGAQKDIIQSNLSVLIECGLARKTSFLLARDTCAAIFKLRVTSGLGESKEPYRLPVNHMLFSSLERLISDGLTDTKTRSWTPFVERALSVIYYLAEQPDVICSRIVKVCIKLLMGDRQFDQQDDIFGSPRENREEQTSVNQRVLARVLTVAGQVALLQLYHLDVSVFTEMKRRLRVREEEKEKKGKGGRKSKSRKSMRDSTASSVTSKQETGLEDELGVGGAEAEDAEAEYIRKICEKEIVTGSNLLYIFCPVVVSICNQPSKYNYPELQSAAALALSKFMLVSSECCDANLQLMFTILEKAENTVMRSNAMIAFGDLTFRFPNLIEPWTPHLYARLRDECVAVRSTAVTILTHLIVNDMVKVKGQISEMAVCIEDRHEKISAAAKSFFFELAQKGNALYNVAPDIISRLSDPDQGVHEDTFRSIMRYLLQFIQKDKHAESLVEKLCHRFRATRTDRQWRDLSYCLSLLPYNEKSFKKLLENLPCFQNKLSDDEVYSCFSQIVTKSKKFAKVEMKALVEEFETTIESLHKKGADESADVDKAAKALKLVASQTNKKHATPAATKANNKNKGKQVKKSYDDTDEEDDVIEKENAPLPPPAGGKRKAVGGSGRTRRKVVINPTFSSDEDFD